ncbi:MAG: hypothetical protein ABIL58_08845 [Pseudomonadota bacterium]
MRENRTSGTVWGVPGNRHSYHDGENIKMKILNIFRKPKQIDRVIYNDLSVTRIRPDGAEETIRWDELHEVGILTTDEGPTQEDVFFFLIAADGKSGCVVPQFSHGCDQLLERLQQLPGFDNQVVIEAMGSTGNAKFVCWRRQVA